MYKVSSENCENWFDRFDSPINKCSNKKRTNNWANCNDSSLIFSFGKLFESAWIAFRAVRRVLKLKGSNLTLQEAKRSGGLCKKKKGCIDWHSYICISHDDSFFFCVLFIRIDEKARFYNFFFVLPRGSVKNDMTHVALLGRGTSSIYNCFPATGTFLTIQRSLLVSKRLDRNHTSAARELCV